MVTGVSLGLNTGPLLFSIFTHDPDAGIKYPISKLADKIKRGGAIDFLEEQEASKENFGELDHWAISDMKWKQSKCYFLQLGGSNTEYKSILGEERLKSREGPVKVLRHVQGKGM